MILVCLLEKIAYVFKTAAFVLVIEVLVALRAQSERNVWTGCTGRNRLLAVSLT